MAGNMLKIVMQTANKYLKKGSSNVKNFNFEIVYTCIFKAKDFGKQCRNLDIKDCLCYNICVK